jgi:hypothetical protein
MSACLQNEALAIDGHADTRRKLGTKGVGRAHNRPLHPCVSFWLGADSDEVGEGLGGIGAIGALDASAACPFAPRLPSA